MGHKKVGKAPNHQRGSQKKGKNEQVPVKGKVKTPVNPKKFEAKPDITVVTYSGHDGELSIACKHSMKKDSTTKIKALEDMKTILKDRGDEVLYEFMPFFVYIYPRLSIDNNRQIRENLQSILLEIINIDNSILDQYLGELIGFWWNLVCDPVDSIGSLAFETFKKAIPINKRKEVIFSHFPHILLNSIHNLNHRPDTVNDLNTTPIEEAEEKYDRMLYCSITSMGKLMNLLTDQQNFQIFEGVENTDLGLMRELRYEVGFKDFFKKKLWIKGFGSNNPLVRKATCDLVSVAVNKCPMLLSSLDSFDDLCGFLFNALNENYRNNLKPALDAIVVFIRQNPRFWHIISFKTQFLPRLQELLVENRDLILDHLLPIFATIPVNEISLFQKNDENLEFFTTKNQIDTVKEICTFLKILCFDEKKDSEFAEKSVSLPKMSNLLLSNIASIEVMTLLLLRKPTPSPVEVEEKTENLIKSDEEENVNPELRNETLELIFNQLIESILTSIEYIHKLSRTDENPGFSVLKPTSDRLEKILISFLPESGHFRGTNLSDLLNGVESLSKIIGQLQKGLNQEINLNIDEWNKFLWVPLSSKVLNLTENLKIENHKNNIESIETWTYLIASILGIMNSAWENKIGLNSGSMLILENLIENNILGLIASTEGNKRDEEEILNLVYKINVVINLIEKWETDLVLNEKIEKIMENNWLKKLIKLTKNDKNEKENNILQGIMFNNFKKLVLITKKLKNEKILQRIWKICQDELSLELILLFFSNFTNFEDFIVWENSSTQWLMILFYCLLEVRNNDNENYVKGFKKLVVEKKWDNKETDRWFLEITKVVKNSDKSLQILLLKTVVFLPNLNKIGIFVVEKSLEIWEKKEIKNEIVWWFILTLYQYSLENGLNSTKSEEKEKENGFHTFLNASVSKDDEEIKNKIIKLFFSRLRNNKNQIEDEKNDDHFKIIKDLIIDQFNHFLINSWESLQKHLIPILPLNMFKNVILGISSVLNSTGVLNEIQPKKWSRHWISLNQLIEIYIEKIPENENINEFFINFFQLNYWENTIKQFEKNDQEKLNSTEITFILQCLLEIQKLSENEKITKNNQISYLPLRNEEKLVFYVLLVLELGEKSIDPEILLEAEEVIFNQIEALNDVSLGQFIVSTLNSISFKDQEVSLIEKKSRNVVLKILQKSLKTREISESKQTCYERILILPIENFEFPVGSKISYVLRKEGLIQFLTDKAKGNGQENEVYKQISFESLKAEVLQVHKAQSENENDFYTIAVFVDEKNSKEIQTEWNRVFVSISEDSFSKDFLISEKTEKNDNKITEISSNFDQNTICSNVMKWLELRFDFLLNGKGFSVSLNEFDFLCTLFSELSKNLENLISSTPEEIFFVTRVVTRMRGLVYFYLQNGIMRKNHSFFEFGFKLLQALLKTSFGVGNGFWLLELLQWKESGTEKSLMDLRTDDFWLSNWAYLISLLLEKNTINPFITIGETILPNLLSSIPSNQPYFTENTILLLKSIWRAKPIISNFKLNLPSSSILRQSWGKGEKIGDEVEDWEVEGFDLVLYDFIEGFNKKVQGNKEKAEQFRVETAMAIHFCLLKRSKKALDSLLKPSLLEKFIPQLLHIMLNKNQNFEVQDDTATIRLVALKLVDVWINCLQPSSERMSGVEVSVEDMVVSGGFKRDSEGFDVFAKEQIEFEEKKEFERDSRVFQTLVGEEIFEILLFHFSTENKIEQKDDIQISTEFKSLKLNEEHSPAIEEDSEEQSGEESEEESEYESEIEYEEFEGKRDKRQKKQWDLLTPLFSWLIVLQFLSSIITKDSTKRNFCLNYLSKSGIHENIMKFLLFHSNELNQFKNLTNLLQRVQKISLNPNSAILPLTNARVIQKRKNKIIGNNSYSIWNDKGLIPVELGNIPVLAAYTLQRTGCVTASLFRDFWSNFNDRHHKNQLTKFVEESVSNALIRREIALIAQAQKELNWDEDFKLSGTINSRMITAVYQKDDEASVEISVKFPSAYPLKNTEIFCNSKFGSAQKWKMQMMQMLQNGSVLDATLHWKQNIEKEFEGVEPCLICMSVLSVKEQKLPSVGCPTCKNKFHSSCLFTWFRSSGKSKCPLCQQPFIL